MARELAIGRGLRVRFEPRGIGTALTVVTDESQSAPIEIGEVAWIQLFDLNEDDQMEVIVEEVQDRGTGVLRKAFCAYRVTPGSLTPLWRGTSYLREASWKPSGAGAIREERGYLRFDRSGAGRQARLTYIEPTKPGMPLRETVLEWQGDGLREAPSR
jgi:hypothetical protein